VGFKPSDSRQVTMQPGGRKWALNFTAPGLLLLVAAAHTEALGGQGEPGAAPEHLAAWGQQVCLNSHCTCGPAPWPLNLYSAHKGRSEIQKKLATDSIVAPIQKLGQPLVLFEPLQF